MIQKGVNDWMCEIDQKIRECIQVDFQKSNKEGNEGEGPCFG